MKCVWSEKSVQSDCSVGAAGLTSAVAGWVDGPRPSHLLGGAVAFSTVVVGNAGPPGSSRTCSQTHGVSGIQFDYNSLTHTSLNSYDTHAHIRLLLPSQLLCQSVMCSLTFVSFGLLR